MHRLLLVMLTFTANVATAAELTDVVPVDILRALIRMPGGEPPRFFDSITDNFPAVDWPTELEVIGAMDFGSVQVVALNSDNASEGFDLMHRAVLEKGWELMISSEEFKSTRMPPPPNVGESLTFCHQSFSGLLSIALPDGREGSRVLVRREIPSLPGYGEGDCKQLIEQVRSSM